MKENIEKFTASDKQGLDYIITDADTDDVILATKEVGAKVKRNEAVEKAGLKIVKEEDDA